MEDDSDVLAGVCDWYLGRTAAVDFLQRGGNPPMLPYALVLLDLKLNIFHVPLISLILVGMICESKCVRQPTGTGFTLHILMIQN